MSDALFLPRELFADAPAKTSVAERPAPRARGGLNFVSGEAVAADLLKALEPESAATAPTPTPARAERRRKPRPGSARGVDLFIA